MKDRSKKKAKSKKPQAPNPIKVDPSRTGTLRRALLTEVRRRFKILRGRVYKFVVTEDCFGKLGSKTLREVMNRGQGGNGQEQDGRTSHWVDRRPAKVLGTERDGGEPREDERLQDLVDNPAMSEAQRRYLNAEFGHDWVKGHGFDNRGPLPEKVKNALDLAVSLVNASGSSPDGRWVTLESGQHVFIGPGGELDVHGDLAPGHGKESGHDGAGEAGTPRGQGILGADGGQMAGEAGGRTGQGPGGERDHRGQPDGQGPAGRVPASVEAVNSKLSRFERLFRESGDHQTADMMGKIREHVNAVGTEEALKSLADSPMTRGRLDPQGPVQYWGAGTGMDSWQHVGHFIEQYLDRHGIKTVVKDNSDPKGGRLISSLVEPDRHDRSLGDVKPAADRFKSKLDEAQHLPGLESTKSLAHFNGGKQPASLTKEVTDKLDKEYGKNQWIVKCSDDNAAAGYGIYFPQKAARIKEDAQGVVWEAGQHLDRYGFKLARNPDTGKVEGLVHSSGDAYHFGSKEYHEVIGGDARHWAEAAKKASEHEHGAKLVPGEFMVSPAFKALNVSDADRAMGKTFDKNEYRIHMLTKPDGTVDVIPHSTWAKDASLPTVFETADTRAAAAAIKKTIEGLPKEYRQGQVYAPDVMKTADGFRVVELNAQGDHNGSGYLHDNPYTIDAYTSHLTGREPMHVAFVRKLLTSRKRDMEEKGKVSTNEYRMVCNALMVLNSNPHHDERGRFTSGEGASGGLSHMDVLNEVADTRDRWQYKGPMRVEEQEGRIFEKGGVQWKEAGNCHLETGLITIHSKTAGASLEDVRHITAHEIMHGVFEKVTKQYESERKKLEEPAETKSGVKMRMDGRVYDQFAHEVPTHARFYKFMEETPPAKFAEDDGVTPYSKAYWKDYAEGKCTFHIAVHETLAEIAGINERTGEVHGSKLFKDYYKAVRDEYWVLTGSQSKRKGVGVTANAAEFMDHEMWLDADFQPISKESACWVKWWKADGTTGFSMVDGAIENFNPFHGAMGHFASEFGWALEGEGPKTQAFFKGAAAVVRVGISAAFVSYTAGQALAERVAKERGMTGEQAKKFRGALAACDMAIAKPLVTAAELTHMPAGLTFAAGMVPVASCAYLLMSTAKDPLAVARAAVKAVASAVLKVAPVKGHHEQYINPSVANANPDQLRDAKGRWTASGAQSNDRKADYSTYKAGDNYGPENHPAFDRFMEGMEDHEGSAPHEEMGQAVTLDKSHKLLVHRNGKLLAAAAWTDRGDHIYLDHMGSAMKGGGVRALTGPVGHAIEQGKPLRFESTEGAEGFYDKLGFKRVGGSHVYETQVKDLKDVMHKIGQKVTGQATANASSGNAGLLADAMEAHGFSDWHAALLCASLDAYKGDVWEAVETAGRCYNACPSPALNMDREEEDTIRCRDGACCPHCGAEMEWGDDGRCDKCGRGWKDNPASSQEPPTGNAKDRSKIDTHDGRWVTLTDGQHVFVGKGGEFAPHGPPDHETLPVAEAPDPVPPKKTEARKDLSFKIGEANPSLPQGSRKFMEDGTKQEIEALRDYSGGHAFMINQSLRSGERMISPKMEEEHKLLSSLFSKNEDLKDPVTVHRGLSMGQDAAKRLIKEMRSAKDGWVNKGYTSTTTIEADVKGMAISMSIRAVNGIDMGPVTKSPEEKEFLIGHGAKFKIGKVTKTDSGWHVEMEQAGKGSHNDSPQRPTGNAGDFASRIGTNSREFGLMTESDKIAAFRRWLGEQVDDVLTDDSMEELLERYARAGFEKGLLRSFDDGKRAAKGQDRLEYHAGTRDEFLRSAFSNPVSVDRVKMLAERSFSDLRGVSEALGSQVQRTLMDGLVQGKSPLDLARDLDGDVEGIGRVRAETIARTEIIRSHAEGQLSSLEQMGVEEVGAQVEWLATPDGKLCPECAGLEGKTFTIDEARGMLPAHPNCRCCWMPAEVGEDDEEKKPVGNAGKRWVKVAPSRTENARWVPASKASKRFWGFKQGDPVYETPGNLLGFSRSLVGLNSFCPTGEGGGVDSSCGKGEGSGGVKPKALEYREPPPKKGVKGGGKKARPKGDDSQTKRGDEAELVATELGFRNILPPGQRAHKPGEVKTKGSTIDLEYDHSGKAYELKMCQTTSTEYRLKAKKEEKDAKLRYAELNNKTAYTMVGVRDVDSGDIHFYASKKPGLIGAEVSEKHFDYVGTVKGKKGG